MKILPLLSLLLLAPLLLRAQTMSGSQDAGTPDASAPSMPAPGAAPASPEALPVMPGAFNHKPDTTPPPSEIAEPLAKFFNTLKANDYTGAYENLLAGSPLGEQKEKMSAFISRTQEAFGIYGPLYDYELYDNYPIGANVEVLTYLTRHQRQPLRWRFIFYRPTHTWTLINIRFDDVLLDLMQ
jgi:hypothetical protein